MRAATDRLVLLYLPTYSPWLNPIEMLWRHFRREVTHCELFETMAALVTAAYDFFARSKLRRLAHARTAAARVVQRAQVIHAMRADPPLPAGLAARMLG